MAEITVNGAARPLAAPTSVSKLLEELGISDRWVAVELNRVIIDRSAFGSTVLSDGDEVEVIRPIGGG